MLGSIKQAFETRQFETALHLCEDARSQESRNPLFFLYQGAIQSKLGQLAEAEASLLKVILLDPTLIAPYKNLAQIYRHQGSWKAVKYMLLASWADPGDSAIRAELLRFYPEKFIYPDADIVFYTGTPFLENKFSPDSLYQKAVGGSETAFIMISREMAKLGRQVLCFCNTLTRKKYDGVEYIPVEEFFIYNDLHHMPVLVSGRFLEPFKFRLNATKKYLWLQDSHGCAIDGDISSCLGNMDRIFTLSDYQMEAIAKKFGIPRGCFEKTRNGFISENFDRAPVEREPFSMIYMSRPCRGLSEALSVFAKLKPRFTALNLHVCFYSEKASLAEDPEFQGVHDKFNQDGVVFHGGLNKVQLSGLLQKTRIMLYPNVSDHETSCIAAIEAMAAGTVVVTSDRCALPETVPHGVGGIIIPFTTDTNLFVNNLSLAVADLFDHPQKLAALSRSAVDYSWQLYPWEKIAREWLDHLL